MTEQKIVRYVVTPAGPTEMDIMVKGEGENAVFEKKSITVKDGYLIKFPNSRNKHSIFLATKADLDEFMRRDADVGDTGDEGNVSFGSEPVKGVKAAMKG